MAGKKTPVIMTSSIMPKSHGMAGSSQSLKNVRSATCANISTKRAPSTHKEKYSEVSETIKDNIVGNSSNDATADIAMQLNDNKNSTVPDS